MLAVCGWIQCFTHATAMVYLFEKSPDVSFSNLIAFPLQLLRNSSIFVVEPFHNNLLNSS